MKVLKPPQSGKRGVVVAFKSRFGQVERTHVPPRTKPTEAQLLVRADFGGASFGWNEIPEDAREAWCAYAKKVRSRPRCGQSGPLTGQNLFTSINRNQALLGLPPYVYPPERPVFDTNPVVAFRITQGRRGVALKLALSGKLAGHILVFASPPYKAGRHYCDDFLYLCALLAPDAGERDITAPYVEKRGKPWPGSRVILRVVQQVNGWRGLPRRIEAVFPAQPPAMALPRRRRAAAGAR